METRQYTFDIFKIFAPQEISTSILRDVKFSEPA